MTKRNYGWVAAVALAAVVGAARVAPAQAPATNPPPTRIAVINLAQVFDKLDEKGDNAAQLDAITKQLNDKQNKMKDDLTKMQNDLDQHPMFTVGSDEYKKAQDDLLQKSADLDAFSRMAQQKIALETRDRYIRLYNHVNTAAAAYCKANGIAILFVADDANLTTARTNEDLLARITGRKVLYADPGFDITQAIVQKMNTEYRLGGNKK